MAFGALQFFQWCPSFLQRKHTMGARSPGLADGRYSNLGFFLCASLEVFEEVVSDFLLD